MNEVIDYYDMKLDAMFQSAKKSPLANTPFSRFAGFGSAKFQSAKKSPLANTN